MSIVRGKLCFLSGLLAMLVGGPGCPQSYTAHVTPETASQPAGEAAASHMAPGRVYDPQEAFSILLPPGWRNAGQSRPHFMTFLGPVEGPFTVNFNVLADKDDGTPVEEARPKVVGWMTRLLGSYQMVEEGFTHVAGEKAYYVSGTFVWDGQKVRNLQYFIRGANKRAYVLTFAAPVGTFAKHRPVFEQAAQTVIIR
jgi:hypothetical protein